jgi:Icc-related predicted phosphoesterase
VRARWGLLLILGLVACFPKGWPPERPGYSIHDFAYDAGPWLVRLAPDRMAVVVMHEDLRTPPVVRWWVRPEAETEAGPEMIEARAIQRGALWIAFLDGLPPDRNLRYVLESELGLIGPFDFYADRSRGEPFRFAAIGDTRTGHRVHRALIEKLAREDVDFLINSGDLVEFGGQLDLWIRFFNIEAPLVSKRPLFASVGNHDNSQPLYFRRLFLTDLFAEGNRYYVQDWGDVRYVALDSEIEIRPGSDQYAFMERALAEGAERGMLMVLSLHYPPYSSGEHGSNEEIRSVLNPICRKYGVEIVLTGHDHNYERTKPIFGTTYLVAASGGAPIRRVIPSDFTAVFRTEPHYVLFDVEDGQLVGRALNLAGEVFDTFIVPDNPPGGPK